MALIQADGLFNGQRLRACSDMARFLWPYLFLASNGFGRLEIDYDAIRRNVFVDFRKFPKLPEFLAIIREYHDNGLLFLYESDGRVWGQWDAKQGTLPRYKSANDKNSPEPPAEAYQRWLNECLLKTKGLTKISEIFGNVPKVSSTCEEERRGVGVGKDFMAQPAAGPEPEPAPIERRNGESPIAEDSPQRKAFVKPTVDEIEQYGRSIGFPIDGEKFWHFYEARGWKHNGGRAMMASWKSTVVTWKKRWSEENGHAANGTQSLGWEDPD